MVPRKRSEKKTKLDSFSWVWSKNFWMGVHPQHFCLNLSISVWFGESQIWWRAAFQIVEGNTLEDDLVGMGWLRCGWELLWENEGYKLAREILLTMIWWGWVGSDVVESCFKGTRDINCQGKYFRRWCGGGGLAQMWCRAALRETEL